MFFRFPPDARWNTDRAAVEFGIGVGEYEGVVRVGRVFQRCSIRLRHPNGAWKPITFIGPGSN